MINQKGIGHILVIILLALALAVGVYLVTHPTVFRSRAANDSKLEIQSKFYHNGTSTSRLLLVKPTYTGSGSPKYFRLANNVSDLDRGTRFPYMADDQKRGFVMWSLDLEDIDSPGQGVGKHTIYTQFLVDDKWTTPSLTDVQLDPTNNSFKLAVKCQYENITNDSQTYGHYLVTVSWDPKVMGDADKMSIMMFQGEGGYLNSLKDPVSVTSGSTQIGIPVLANNYSIFATATNGNGVVGTSELSFSCTEQDKSVTINSSDLPKCTNINCPFSWSGSGNSSMVELTGYLNDPGTKTDVLAFSQIGNMNGSYGGSYVILPAAGTYTRYTITALKPAVDPQAAGLVKKNPTIGGQFTASESDLDPIRATEVSCEVSATNNGGTYSVSYNGQGGATRVWLESQDLVSPIAGTIKVDGNDPLRTYSGNLDPYGKIMQYQIASCDGSTGKGCSGSINSLEVPSGKYSLHCDVTKDNGNKCSGYIACSAEGGKLDCVEKLKTFSCGSNDHAEFSK